MPIAILFALGLYGIVSIICNVSLQKTWNLININCLFLSLLEIFHSFGEFLIICEGTTNLDLYLPLLGTHGHWEWGSWASPTHCDMGSQFLWSSSKTSDFQTVTLYYLLGLLLYVLLNYVYLFKNHFSWNWPPQHISVQWHFVTNLIYELVSVLIISSIKTLIYQ